jgi:hypothetical protein
LLITEFIDNLYKEQETNLKNKIFVYFEAKPCDDKLETNSVYRSLEHKIMCLIFIPIISGTFCDSKSFAGSFRGYLAADYYN